MNSSQYDSSGPSFHVLRTNTMLNFHAGKSILFHNTQASSRERDIECTIAHAEILASKWKATVWEESQAEHRVFELARVIEVLLDAFTSVMVYIQDVLVQKPFINDTSLYESCFHERAHPLWGRAHIYSNASGYLALRLWLLASLPEVSRSKEVLRSCQFLGPQRLIGLLHSSWKKFIITFLLYFIDHVFYISKLIFLPQSLVSHNSNSSSMRVIYVKSISSHSILWQEIFYFLNISSKHLDHCCFSL